MLQLSLGMKLGSRWSIEIAIEISQLEATISGLRERASVMEKLEKIVAEKDGKITEIEGQMSEKLVKVENEALELRQLVWEYDDKLMNLDAKMEVQRPLLNDQLKRHTRIFSWDAIHLRIDENCY